MGAAAFGQPRAERQQPRRGGLEAAHLAPPPTRFGQAHRRHHGVLVHVEPRAARVENLHRSLPPRRRRRTPRMQTLDGALPGLAAPGAIGGASGAPDPTDTRARPHHDETALSADGPRQPATGFIHARSDKFGEELIPTPRIVDSPVIPGALWG